jgi:GAF domain-containing protein
VIKCRQCRIVFSAIGDALSQRVETATMLEAAARAIVCEFDLKACHFRVISRDRRTLDSTASYGLSEKFLAKGPVDTDKSVTAALAGEVVWVADCATDPRVQYPAALAEEGIASMLTVPLETRGQVIGVMRLSTATRREFSEDEIELFKVAALFCAGAIVDRMFRQILGHVTASTRSLLQLDEALNAIVAVVCEDLRARGCAIMLAEAGSSSFEPKAAYGIGPGFVGQMSELFSEEAVTAVRGGECVAILDGRSDQRIRRPRDLAREGVSSILLVPLMIRGRAIGALIVFTHLPYRFSVDEQQLMTAIGEQCSLAIDNAMMFAALKRRYDALVDDFQIWFEHSPGHSRGGAGA